MAENETPKQVLLNRIYVKDCSFESPRSPEVFNAPMSPEVKLDLRTANKRVQGDLVEVVLSITAEAQQDSRTLFVVEVHQAGVFTITGFDANEYTAIVSSYCPSILFPYAREVISDFVTKGGMPSLLLQPVNFDTLYMQSLAAAAAETKPK
ncbi:MAG TPA: protein-export chaperone SecB [Gammaproteobacteria bacterium]|jgi:preprotein translocase subunit SecB